MTDFSRPDFPRPDFPAADLTATDPADVPSLSPDIVERARALYDGATPNAALCEFLGMTQRQFLAFRKAQGWPLRDRFALPPRRLSAWTEDDLRDDWEPPPENLKAEELIARMEKAAGREFARAERAMENKRPKSAEARLRITGHLVRIMNDLQRVRRDGVNGDDKAAPIDDKPPRTLQELREELARRLERLAGEHTLT